MAEDGSLRLVIEPNTTYEAWPSVSCHHARRQCRRHCHEEKQQAVKAMNNNNGGPLYISHPKDGRRLGYDLCLQYGDTTPDDGIMIVLQADVEHCSTKDVDPDWHMKLCCGFSPSPIDKDQSRLFGWYPNCPLKNTIVFA